MLLHGLAVSPRGRGIEKVKEKRGKSRERNKGFVFGGEKGILAVWLVVESGGVGGGWLEWWWPGVGGRGKEKSRDRK